MAMNEVERRAAQGWYGDQGHCKETKGMDLEWIFEKAWRNRAVKEVEAALEGKMSPVENGEVETIAVVTKKRKAGSEEVEQRGISRFTRIVTKRRKLVGDIKGMKRVGRN
jgi:hypothetical protein